VQRETLSYDVVIVGAGPAGLCAAIRYAQLCRQANQQPSICVVDKGQEVGAHILSGAVLDPRTLNELLPDWQNQNAPIETKVSEDHFVLLTQKHAFNLPTPPQMRNEGNFVVSLGLLCKWLAQIAQDLGVEIYPGFAATQFLLNEQNTVIGINIGDKGLDKNRQPKPNFLPGINLLGKQTLFAEGCRGSLSQQLIAHFSLSKNAQPQTYGIGLKEIWEIDPSQHRPGKVVHTVGWPLDQKTYGGSFIYHWGKNLLSIGFVVGLDYQNPFLDPYQEFQRFKHHPMLAPVLANGRCINYGARALNEGGYQSIPHLTFAGGMLIGDSAGFLNVPKIKGIHNAMKSGSLAAEAVFAAFAQQSVPSEITQYQEKIKQSWIFQELYQARNIRPGFRWGLWPGLLNAAIDTTILRGHAPWTFSHANDYASLKLAKACQPIIYPKPDGKISFDKMTSVALTNVFHEENEPCHLILKDPTLAITVNWQEYAGPEQRYCPAGVYEFVDDQQGNKRLQINAVNCIHCKTCDIKDPRQNIVWTPPEGGEGPHYGQM
jgi:electron-transferring-flavoprotein dehydrogenase